MNFFGNRYTSSPRPTVESRSNAFQGTNKFLLLYVTSEILLESIQEKKNSLWNYEFTSISSKILLVC